MSDEVWQCLKIGVLFATAVALIQVGWALYVMYFQMTVQMIER